MIRNQIRKYLEQVCQNNKERHFKIGKYFGLEDFILKNGYIFSAIIPLPSNMERGSKGSCYKNTFFNVIMDTNQYYYCEGYAGVEGKFLPHAWMANKDLEVIDSTWTFSDKYEYYGIIFKFSFIQGRVLRKNMEIVSLIENREEGYPLLKMPRKELLKNIVIPKDK